MLYYEQGELIVMKPIKDIDSDNNNVSLPETIENKLNEAEIDYEEGRNHTE